MEIKLNPIKIDEFERGMGMRHFFSPLTEKVDAISATANVSGFTQLTAIARCYGWSPRRVNAVAMQCNMRREVAVVQDVTPKLFLVPHTRRDDDSIALMQDLLDACGACSVSTLHFTHYGMLTSRVPLAEIEKLFGFIKMIPKETILEKIIWDIDEQYISDVKELWSRYFKEGNK